MSDGVPLEAASVWCIHHCQRMVHTLLLTRDPVDVTVHLTLNSAWLVSIAGPLDMPVHCASLRYSANMHLTLT